MPLETANYVYDLVQTNPPDTDLVQQGDDHLRMIKKVMQQTFPNVTGPNLPTSTGTANAQVVTHVYGPAAYSAGQLVTFKAGFANTGATTINVNGAGVVPVLRSGGAACGGGEIVAGVIYTLIYDSSVSAFTFVIGTGGGGAAYAVVGSTPPNPNAPNPAPPMGLLFADTSVPDSAVGPYLPLSGGTLTGVLTVAPTGNSQIYVTKSASGSQAGVVGTTAGSARWNLVLGNSIAEGSGNVGSDFVLNRYDNTGVFIDSPLTITRSTGQVAIKGTPTNDSAAAGYVGEYIQSIVTAGVTLPNGSAANVTTISLTAGDWDITGEVWFVVGTGGAALVAGNIGTSSAAMGGSPLSGWSRNQLQVSIPASSTQALAIATTRASLSATTTYYLTALASFGSGTCTATGRIGARRIR